MRLPPCRCQFRIVRLPPPCRLLTSFPFSSSSSNSTPAPAPSPGRPTARPRLHIRETVAPPSTPPPTQRSPSPYSRQQPSSNIPPHLPPPFLPPSSPSTLSLPSSSARASPSSRSRRSPTSRLATKAERRNGSWLGWLSGKLGIDEFAPALRLYSVASSRAASPAFTSPRTMNVASTVDGHCALLTLHVWLLYSRVSELMYAAGRLQPTTSNPWKQRTQLLFQLFWQEMDSLVRREGEGGEAEADGMQPHVFTVAEYRQLAYGAMVSYDRAWLKLRQSGEKADLIGALWRNVHSGQAEVSEATIHRLLHYVEHMKQRTNRWTEEQIVQGDVDWGPLPEEAEAEEQVEETAAVMLRYTGEAYDGSRVAEGESLAVPLSWKWWQSDDMIAVVDAKSPLQVSGGDATPTPALTNSAGSDGKSDKG